MNLRSISRCTTQINATGNQPNKDSLPEFDQVVAASRDEALDIVWFLPGRLVDQAAGDDSRSPTHCVTADLQENPSQISEPSSQQSYITLKVDATQKQTAARH